MFLAFLTLGAPPFVARSAAAAPKLHTPSAGPRKSPPQKIKARTTKSKAPGTSAEPAKSADADSSADGASGMDADSNGAASGTSNDARTPLETETRMNAPAGKTSAATSAANSASATNNANAANSANAGATEVKEDKQGVKTYKFGTVEVEGRLKSPQIIYFLRRVRAEFDAGLLGHRSFRRELIDTRNEPVLR